MEKKRLIKVKCLCKIEGFRGSPGLWIDEKKAKSLRQEIILDSATREDALKNSSVTGARINARNALALAATYQAEQPPAPRRGLEHLGHYVHMFSIYRR